MPSEVVFTDEQRAAIERRSGDLLLDAGAGSGKTSVLVERFARSVLDDGVDVHSILTITFTDKAAAELRDRIRSRLRALGAVEYRARHGGSVHLDDPRLLRSGAAGQCAGYGHRSSIRGARARELRAADGRGVRRRRGVGRRCARAARRVGVGPLRAAVLAVYAELRSRGQAEPELPPLGAAAVGLPAARASLAAAAAVAARSSAVWTARGRRSHRRSTGSSELARSWAARRRGRLTWTRCGCRAVTERRCRRSRARRTARPWPRSGPRPSGSGRSDRWQRSTSCCARSELATRCSSGPPRRSISRTSS